MEQYEAARKLGHFERSLAKYDLCERDLGVPTQIKDLNRCLTTCLAREHTRGPLCCLPLSLSFAARLATWPQLRAAPTWAPCAAARTCSLVSAGSGSE